MIVGTGDIGTVLQKAMRPADDNFIFFASGVSNSRETDLKAYFREFELLKAQDYTKHLVYFSSLGVLDGETKYLDHKRYMESLVQLTFDAWTIVRLGNIDWGTNPNTIINFMRNEVKAGRELVVQDVYRHVVSESEFLYWIDKIPNWNCEINIPGRMMKVKDIVEEYIYGYTNPHVY